MLLPKLLILISNFNQLLWVLEATRCPKGQKVSKSNTNQCEDCSDGYYQPVENESQSCRPCNLCEVDSGSEIQRACTKESDAVCRCRGGFSKLDDDFSVCTCATGFGLIAGECLKCEEGYFSTQRNTPCSKWKDCKSAGVKTPGSPTSDVTCNDELMSEFIDVYPDNLNKTQSTGKKNKPPHEGAQTPVTLMTIITRASQQTTKEENSTHFPNFDSGNHDGFILIILGILGILLILTFIIFKMDVIPCWRKKTTQDIQTKKKNPNNFTQRFTQMREMTETEKDSACRRPVEESGDNIEKSLNPHSEEP